MQDRFEVWIPPIHVGIPQKLSLSWNFTYPDDPCMVIFTYIWVVYTANISKYPIHGSSGIGSNPHTHRSHRVGQRPPIRCILRPMAEDRWHDGAPSTVAGSKVDCSCRWGATHLGKFFDNSLTWFFRPQKGMISRILTIIYGEVVVRSWSNLPRPMSYIVLSYHMDD